MIFGGIQKTSLIDYPGKLSSVLFLSGCNYDCPYCHNPDLARGSAVCPDYLTETWLFDFLDKRKEFLDGVVISGGEPTLQVELPFLCRRIKAMGYAVKLDTNGSRPRVLRHLIRESLVDFIAMDIKTDPEAYFPMITRNSAADAVLASIRLIMESTVDYEFRTTCVRPLVDGQVIEKISRLISGCRQYSLQQFHDADVLNPEFFRENIPPYTPEELLSLKSIAEPQVNACTIRGADQ